tara:strand:+ start:143 stop:499 length:357 start_codon:yes stop_codon:yes gene_type:complete
MELSSPRFKALAVSSGFTFWFFIITSATGFFSLEIFVIFIVSIFSLTQILSFKVSKALDYFAIFNTKLFLGILFVVVVSIYGILFRILKIDLLRLKNNIDSYWLNMEQLSEARISKQY